jgi:hypothetical protein
VVSEHTERLMARYKTGERVRATARIVFDAGEEVAEGTVGWVQDVNVNGCAPLVTVAWDGRGGTGEPPSITAPCSVESLERC